MSTTKFFTTTAVLGFGLFLARCAADEPAVVGTWVNGTSQTLVVGDDLKGKLTQEAACSQTLNVSVRRDPYEGFSIRFDDLQLVFFPVAMRENFGANEYFCSSNESVPMCAFCQVEGDAMNCKAPTQKIDPAGEVTHDCNWMRVATSSTSTTAGPCTNPREREGICGSRTDAGVSASDAGS